MLSIRPRSFSSIITLLFICINNNAFPETTKHGIILAKTEPIESKDAYTIDGAPVPVESLPIVEYTLKYKVLCLLTNATKESGNPPKYVQRTMNKQESYMLSQYELDRIKQTIIATVDIDKNPVELITYKTINTNVNDSLLIETEKAGYNQALLIRSRNINENAMTVFKSISNSKEKSSFLLVHEAYKILKDTVNDDMRQELMSILFEVITNHNTHDYVRQYAAEVTEMIHMQNDEKDNAKNERRTIALITAWDNTQNTLGTNISHEMWLASEITAALANNKNNESLKKRMIEFRTKLLNYQKIISEKNEEKGNTSLNAYLGSLKSLINRL